MYMYIRLKRLMAMSEICLLCVLFLSFWFLSGHHLQDKHFMFCISLDSRNTFLGPVLLAGCFSLVSLFLFSSSSVCCLYVFARECTCCV